MIKQMESMDVEGGSIASAMHLSAEGVWENLAAYWNIVDEVCVDFERCMAGNCEQYNAVEDGFRTRESCRVLGVEILRWSEDVAAPYFAIGQGSSTDSSRSSRRPVSLWRIPTVLFRWIARFDFHRYFCWHSNLKRASEQAARRETTNSRVESMRND